MRKLFMLCLMLSTAFISADDIKETNNSKKVKGKSYTLKLIEDLRFGSEEGGDEFLWPGTSISVEANGAGHMFICDPMGKRVLQFDEKGAFVKLVGQPGEGPGEFKFLQTFQVLGDGKGVAFGSSGALTSVSWFNPDMSFKDRDEKSDINGIMQSLLFAPDGGQIATTILKLDFAESKMITSAYLTDANLQVKDTLSTYATMSFNPQRMTDPAFWTDFMADQFQPYSKGDMVYWVFDKNGNFYSGKNGRYEITRRDSKGAKNLVITRDYDRKAWTEEDINELVYPIKEALTAALPEQLQDIVSETVLANAIKKADLPKIQHPVQGLKVTEDGILLVIHETSLSKRLDTADLFDKKGKYLGQYTHPGLGLQRMIFKNGYAYTVETDEDEENTLVRYKVKLVPAS